MPAAVAISPHAEMTQNSQGYSTGDTSHEKRGWSRTSTRPRPKKAPGRNRAIRDHDRRERLDVKSTAAAVCDMSHSPPKGRQNGKRSYITLRCKARRVSGRIWAGVLLVL